MTEHAFGTSMDDVPATTDMRFLNGAVAFAYVGTLLLKYVDKGDGQARRPHRAVGTDASLRGQGDPFNIFTYEERLKYALGRPQQFPPGTNWSTRIPTS